MPPKRQVKVAKVTAGSAPTLSERRANPLIEAVLMAKPLVECATPSASPSRPDHVSRLCSALHGMLLVAQIEKAQQRTLLTSQRNCASVHSPPSICIDSRWLRAVTQYCTFTVTLDDVARVAASFPEWVRLTCSRTRQMLPSLSSGDATTPDNRNDQWTETGIRLYILQSRIPSALEAQEALNASMKAMGKSIQQQPLRDVFSDVSAATAYSQQDMVAAVDHPTTAQQTLAHIQRPPSHSTPVEDTHLTDVGKSLLSGISRELQQSLSKAKLQEVLRQMEKDAGRVEEDEYERIERQQEEERLVSTYAHIRSLFGSKQVSMSAAALLQALEAESRYEDSRGFLRQMELLLSCPASGVSAFTLEGVVAPVPTAPDPQPRRAHHHRKRPRKDVGPAARPSADDGATPAALMTVGTLTSLSAAQLAMVLVRLDRNQGSLQRLLAHFEAAETPSTTKRVT